MSPATFPCPHCGAAVRTGARFCRHCGSSDDDGWRDADHSYDDQDDDFDYDRFIQDEFATTMANTRTRPIWRFAAVVLLMIFAGGLLFQLL
jgi:hypothetical protein